MHNRIEHMAPLHRPPRRIRPPFNVDHYAPNEPRPGETTDQWRARRHADQVAALLEPLDGVELGTYDRRIIDWLAGWDTETIATVASLLYRARAVDATGSA